MKRTKQIATHDNPVWRSKANFLIAADLSENGLEGASEQLWARREADNEFIICCIPFFTYGISLGDHVATFMDESRKYIFFARYSRGRAARHPNMAQGAEE